MIKRNILCIIGPTGVGKTSFSLSIAPEINAEIINADSMQIYKYMDIGTAKPSKEEMSIVPHHLIDIIEPDEDFNVKNYVNLAEEKLVEIINREKTPLIVGGTGLYIKGLLYGIFDSPSRNLSIRKEIEEEINLNGIEVVYNKLKEVDLTSANKIHINDRKRIIRALEVYYITGKPISQLQQEQSNNYETPFKYKFIGITDDRNIVYNRINKRCDEMINDGFIDEVKYLREIGYHKDLQSMKAIGYSHINNYLDNEYDYNEMIRLFKRDSRRYAKRQWTLFNSIKEVNWIKIDWNKQLFLQIPKNLVLD